MNVVIKNTSNLLEECCSENVLKFRKLSVKISVFLKKDI